MSPYLDTSALAKWYLNEPRSEDVEAFMLAQTSAEVSSLTVVELRCLLARRRRAAEIDAATEMRVFGVFQEDIRHGVLRVHPLDNAHALAALDILAGLPLHPLRTLDALHLAIADSIAAETLATADRVMADAAEEFGLEVVRFG